MKKFNYSRLLSSVTSLVIALLFLSGCGRQPVDSSIQFSSASEDSPYESGSPTYEKWTIIGTLELEDHAYDAAISGNKVYIAESFNGLKIIDTSDPGDPAVIGRISPYESGPYSVDNFYGIALINDLAIVALIPGCPGYCMPSRGMLRIYDITDPVNPQRLSRVETGVEDVITDADSNYVYATGYGDYYNSFGSLLKIIDISDPLNPEVVGTTGVVATGKLAKSGDTLLMTYNDSMQFEGIQAINVSNPTDPYVVGSPLNMSIINVCHSPIALSNEVAYIADWSNGLKVVDVSDPVNIVIIKNISSQSSITDIAVYEDHLFVAAGPEVKVYDISDPANPVSVGSIETPTNAILVRVHDGIGAIVTAEVRQNETYGYTILEHEKLCIFIP